MARRVHEYDSGPVLLQVEVKQQGEGEALWIITTSTPVARLPADVRLVLTSPAQLRLGKPHWPIVPVPELRPELAVASNRGEETAAFCRQQRSWLMQNVAVARGASLEGGRAVHRVIDSGTPPFESKAAEFVRDFAVRASGAFSGPPAPDNAWETLALRRRVRRRWQILCISIGTVTALAVVAAVQNVAKASPLWLPVPFAMAGILILAMILGAVVGWLFSRWLVPPPS